MGQFWGKSAKYSHEEKPVKKWYTDSALTLLTGCLSFITFLLNATACYGGNLRHLAPYDLNGLSLFPLPTFKPFSPFLQLISAAPSWWAKTGSTFTTPILTIRRVGSAWTRAQQVRGAFKMIRTWFIFHVFRLQRKREAPSTSLMALGAFKCTP